MIIIKAEALAGSSIVNTTMEMVELAKKCEAGVTLNFNGVRLTAFPHSTPSAMQFFYRRNLESTEDTKEQERSDAE